MSYQSQGFLIDTDSVYCTLCDRNFLSKEARADHLYFATNHPKCETCDINFANGNALRNHYVISKHHNYCASCEIHFGSPAGLRWHIEHAVVHRDDSDDEYDSDEDEVENEDEGWEDRQGAELYPEENERYASWKAEGLEDERISVEDEYWDADDDELDTDDEEDAPFDVQGLRLNINDSDHDHSVSPDPDAVAGTDTDAAGSSESAAPLGILFNCALCSKAPQSATSTRCGHVFCSQCIADSLKRKKQCPACQEPAIARQLRRIFLSAN
ncbi:hypothetical protein BXZ70DRAFT_209226 [Cristinia sonorae]|uniref:RING-type domain-containing protein n=1 Tax=Cristinia sonorae TaxID=1940300 RepID=A0A8K0UMM3_9AGAR|nr:hypothetical protein BXZ70DRAFT_209226 [Cristinia sonorae]